MTPQARMGLVSSSLVLFWGCVAQEGQQQDRTGPHLHADAYVGEGHGGRVELRLCDGVVMGGHVETAHRDFTDAPYSWPIRVTARNGAGRYRVVTLGGDAFQYVDFELLVTDVSASALHYRLTPLRDRDVVVYSGTAVRGDANNRRSGR